MMYDGNSAMGSLCLNTKTTEFRKADGALDVVGMKKHFVSIMTMLQEILEASYARIATEPSDSSKTSQKS
jgi:hypothetical protein